MKLNQMQEYDKISKQKMYQYKNMNCFNDWQALTDSLNTLRLAFLDGNYTRNQEFEHDRILDKIFSTKPYWLATAITSDLVPIKY